MCLRIAIITSSETSGELFKLPIAEETLSRVLGSSRNEKNEWPFSTPKRTFPTTSSTSSESETCSEANLSLGQFTHRVVVTENRSLDSKTISAEQTTSYSGSPSGQVRSSSRGERLTFLLRYGEPADVAEKRGLVGEPEVAHAELVDEAGSLGLVEQGPQLVAEVGVAGRADAESGLSGQEGSPGYEVAVHAAAEGAEPDAALHVGDQVGAVKLPRYSAG